VIALAGADATHPSVIDSEAADDTQASFSPDGTGIVYIRQPTGMGGEFGTLVTSDLAGAGAHVVSASLQAAAPEFTPDGRHILFVREGAFSSAGGLWSIGTDGSGLRRLLPHARAFDASPNGSHLAYVNQQGALYVANRDGSHRRLLARKPDGSDPVEAVRYSPDGRLIVFAAQAAASLSGDSLFRVAAGGGAVRRIRGSGDTRTVTSGLSWQPLGR
jgi:Tol biopolymer transport system component